VTASPDRPEESTVTIMPGEIPFTITSAFVEPSEFLAQRALNGPAQIRTSTGDIGWLVSRYADVTTLCADSRIGKSHPDPAHAARLWYSEIFSPESNYNTELADHRRARRHLAKWYGPRRVELMRPRMREILDEQLRKVIAAGPPLDLKAHLITPFAAQVIYEFVGIPPADREKIQAWSHHIRVRQDTYSTTGRSELRQYIGDLLERKKQCPGQDAISGAVRSVSHARQHEQEDILKEISAFSLADQDVIGARIAYGTLFLLQHQQQLQRLLDDRSLVAGAVEEVLRVAVPGGSWIPRYALDDIDHSTADIRAGDLVVFAMQSANNDAAVFGDPGNFDITRSPNRHLAFGHGKFFCLGAHLSRTMLAVAFDGIFPRLPGLRLAVAAERVQLEDSRVTGGLRSLPVTWD